MKLAHVAFVTLTATLAYSSLADAASVETYNLTGINHNWTSIGLSTAAKGGILLAQATTENGDDAGTTRIDPSFQVRYQEYDNGNHDLAEDVSVVSFIGSLADLGVTGESGTFYMSASSRSSTYKLNFQHEYINPVVFVQAVSSYGSDPIAVVPVVTSPTYAVIAMPEGSTSDGVHYASETIHYVVIEEGSYYLSNNRVIEAGIVDVTTTNYSSSGYTEITPKNYLSDDIAFFAQPQTAAAATYRGIRASRTVNTVSDIVDKFRVRHMLDEPLEDAGTTVTTGTVGYLAVGFGAPRLTSELTATYTPVSPTWVVDDEMIVDDANTVDLTCDGDSTEQWLKSSDGSWGTSRFAASYDAQVGIGGEASTGYDRWIGAKASADVTLFGVTQEVLSIGAQATKENNTQDSRAWLEVVGFSLFDESLSVGVDEDFPRTFAYAEARFYGVTVKASAIGTLGIEASATLGASGITISAEPYASITASVGASIGAWCASVGVEGSLTLLRVGVPAEGSVSFGSVSTWSFDSSVDLTTLDGSVDLVIDYCVDDTTKELFSWDGLGPYSFDLLSGYGCF